MCGADSIELRRASDRALIHRAARRGFDFFDYYCHHCRAKVLSCEIDAANLNRCVEVEHRCRHFVGTIVSIHGKYEKPALAALRLTLDSAGNDLFLRARSGGKLRKVEVVVPQGDATLSYWNNLDAAGAYINHLLFVPEGTE